MTLLAIRWFGALDDDERIEEDIMIGLVSAGALEFRRPEVIR